ncbi:hypothetical protein [uncultured archaeal virus]|uniref:Uncharacterized protein n=1 Tax=uncultured archaeal virus TaxID=1960247 RepID=A0A8B0LS60_9VIRU|nr:hypothetical protein [uncultured archaeal virus]
MYKYICFENTLLKTANFKTLCEIEKSFVVGASIKFWENPSFFPYDAVISISDIGATKKYILDISYPHMFIANSEMSYFGKWSNDTFIELNHQIDIDHKLLFEILVTNDLQVQGYVLIET